MIYTLKYYWGSFRYYGMGEFIEFLGFNAIFGSALVMVTGSIGVFSAWGFMIRLKDKHYFD